MHPYEELHKFDESQIHNPLGKDVWDQNGVCPDSVSATRPLRKQKLCGIFFRGERANSLSFSTAKAIWTSTKHYYQGLPLGLVFT